MAKIGLYGVVPFLSFFGGFFAYIQTLRIVWNQSLNGDMNFVLIYGAIAFFIFAVPVYLGIIYMIDKKFKRYKGFLYPFGCILVFFIPTLAIMLTFGSINIFSPEAMLFHAFFITAGLIFGLGNWGVKRIKIN